MSLFRRGASSDAPCDPLDHLGEGIDVDDLPSPPGVALQILSLANDPDAGVNDLAGVIRHDSALTARLLKVVNSPAYGMSRTVDSIERAVAVLGFRQVRLLSLGFSLTDALPDIPATVGFDLGTYWLRSVVGAGAAQETARRCAPAVAEIAFIAGLLHPLGRMALATLHGDTYRTVLEIDPWPDAELETGTLGYSSADLTAALMQRWTLPDPLVMAARYAHRPNAAPADTEGEMLDLIRVVGFGLEVAAAATSRVSFEELAAHGETHLGVDADAVESLVRAVMEQLGDSADLVSATLPDGVCADQLMGQGRAAIMKVLTRRSGLSSLTSAG